MDLNVNIWAVLVGAFIHFALGGLWYSPLLFAEPWARLKGIDMNPAGDSGGDQSAGPTASMFVGSFIASLVLATTLALILSFTGAGTLPESLIIGLLVWLGFTAAPQYANALFGGDVRIWLIDVGYPFVSTLLLATLFWLW